MAMSSTDSTEDGGRSRKIAVEAPDIDGIIEALGLEVVSRDDIESEPAEYPEELDQVLETFVDIYAGVDAAMETDSRGRSRKIIRQFADREDLSSDAVGHHLRVLEEHDLVVQDGNRWRIAGVE